MAGNEANGPDEDDKNLIAAVAAYTESISISIPEKVRRLTEQKNAKVQPTSQVPKIPR